MKCIYFGLIHSYLANGKEYSLLCKFLHYNVTSLMFSKYVSKYITTLVKCLNACDITLNIMYSILHSCKKYIMMFDNVPKKHLKSTHWHNLAVLGLNKYCTKMKAIFRGDLVLTYVNYYEGQSMSLPFSHVNWRNRSAFRLPVRACSEDEQGGGTWLWRKITSFTVGTLTWLETSWVQSVHQDQYRPQCALLIGNAGLFSCCFCAGHIKQLWHYFITV